MADYFVIPVLYYIILSMDHKLCNQVQILQHSPIQNIIVVEQYKIQILQIMLHDLILLQMIKLIIFI